MRPLPPETMKRILAHVRGIELRMARELDSGLSGCWRSAFRGRGIEAESVRPYTAEDDAAQMDWRVTARLQRPHVRVYAEERALTCLIAVDLSGSMGCRGLGRLPRQAAADMVALLALAAVRNQDRVGLLLFSSVPEQWVRPAAGRRHALRLVCETLGLEPTRADTSVAVALDALRQLGRERSIIFLISDLADHGYEGALRRLSRRHEVVILRLWDPLDAVPSGGDPVLLEDAETGRLVDARTMQEPACRQAGKEDEDLRRAAARCGAQVLNVSCADDAARQLAAYLSARARTGGGRMSGRQRRVDHGVWRRPA